MKLKRNPIYQELGLKTIINAAGPKTTYGGTRIKPEVLASMTLASNSFVDIIELNRSIGKYIAKLTGAQAGIVTNGASNALVLAAAACMTDGEIEKVRMLPHTEGLKNEIILQTSQWGEYSYFYALTGAKLIKIGTPSSCTESDLTEAINERTAAIAFLEAPRISKKGLKLSEVIVVAHKEGIPVIVDAAPMLPPRSNLTRFIQEGADLVAISGGKFIHGPQSTGILFGKQRLIEAALANSSPNHAIGRVSKVSREEMVGLYTALKIYHNIDERKEVKKYYSRIKIIYDNIKDIPEINASIEYDQVDFLLPTLTIRFTDLWNGPPYDQWEKIMLDSTPPILIQYLKGSDHLIIHPIGLEEWEAKIVSKKLKENLRLYAC